MANIDMDVNEFRRAAGIDALKLAEPNRKVSKSDRVKLEDAFLAAWRVVAKDLPEPILQFRFHKERKWRLDFAWHPKLAVELQGGGFVKGGHVRGAQQEKDFEKLRAAARQGWLVLQYGTKSMDDPYAVAAEVAEVLRERIKSA